MATETKKPMTREEYELERKRIRELMNKTEEENKKYLASQPPLTEEQTIKLFGGPVEFEQAVKELEEEIYKVS